MKQHTAKSLARYLGGKFRITDEGDFALKSVATGPGFIDLVFVDGRPYRFRSEFETEDPECLPILYSIKTLAKRPEDVAEFACLGFNVYGLVFPERRDDPDQFSLVYGDERREIPYHTTSYPQYIEHLLEKGYGAVPDKESPTGYVDLFGYPCICRDEE